MGCGIALPITTKVTGVRCAWRLSELKVSNQLVSRSARKGRVEAAQAQAQVQSTPSPAAKNIVSKRAKKRDGDKAA